MFYAKSQNSIPLPSSTPVEPTFMELLKSYLDDNQQIGYLIFQVFQHSPLEGILPVPNAKITISKSIGNNYFVSKVLMTDNNGKTDSIPLPTVSATLSTVPTNSKVCSKYNARVEAPNFLTTDIFDICVFENITAVQPVDLLPSPGEPVHRIYESEPRNYEKQGNKNGYN